MKNIFKISKKLYFGVFCFILYAIPYTLHAADDTIPTEVGDINKGNAALQDFIEKAYNNYLLTFGSALTVIMLIWSGIQYMTSGGNPEGIESAKKRMFYTLTGYILLLLVGAIYKFLVK